MLFEIASRADSRTAAARRRPVDPVSRRVPDRLDIAAKRPISGFDLLPPVSIRRSDPGTGVAVEPDEMLALRAMDTSSGHRLA